MADFIGTIPVPDLPSSGTFPLIWDYPQGRSIDPKVVVHSFAGANRKIEQRFMIGSGLRKWRGAFANLTDDEQRLLLDFWNARQGPYQPFTCFTPNADGTTTARIVQFEDAPLTFDRFIGRAQTGLTFVEVLDNASAPVYPLNATALRFPTSAMEQALLDQVQRFVPLLRIQPVDPAYPAMYLADRRCTIGTQLYQPRILNWSNITQKLGGQADGANFVLGNADRVMRDVANSTDLYKADVVFSLYHINTGVQVVFWRGNLVNFQSSSKVEFSISVTDGLQKLTLQYPLDRLTNTCWKQQAGLYNDHQNCPYAENGSLNPAYPQADASFCDGGYLTPNGCKAHSMKRWYGALQLEPQTVRIKDNTTGFMGMGQMNATATSQVSDSILNLPVKEIYTDIPIQVNCLMAAGRDESEFYSGLGIVGGSITSFGEGTIDSAGNPRLHTLDGAPDHTWPKSTGGEYPGRDPAGPTDYFSLNQSGNQVNGDPNKVYVGNSTVLDNYAAGISFLVLRIADEKGFQLTTLDQHAMIGIVGQGRQGWVWSAPGARSQQVLVNPIWVWANVYLRGIGLRSATIEQCEAALDIPACIAAAAICDLQVPKLIGAGNETQFVLRGVIEDIKPLKDWLQEILNNCLGNYVYSAGKLKPLIREDAAAAHSFSAGNMVLDSLVLSPRAPDFNRINVTFANSDYEFVKDGIPVAAVDHVLYVGQTIDGYLNLLSSGKSMAARIGGTLLKEALGGATLAEWKKARTATWKTTVLAMGVEVGIGISIDDPEMPTGTGLFRITSGTLNTDYSIDFQGDTITDSMYDQVAGPKLTDVPANPVQIEMFPEPRKSAWCPNYEIPPAGDPLYSPDDRTFGLSCVYELEEGSNSQVARVVVTGERPINTFWQDAQPPFIRTQSQSSAGGSLKAGLNYWVRVHAQDANGNWSPGSNIRHFSFSDGPNTCQISIGGIEWPAGTVAGAVFAGDDEKTICWQEQMGGNAWVWNGPLKQSTFNAPSLMQKGSVIVRAKRGLHFGIVGLLFDEVGAGRLRCGTFINFDHDLTGRWVYVIGDASDGSARPEHYLIHTFDAVTGNMYVTPDPEALGVARGDLFTIRLIPQIFDEGGAVIGDSFIANAQYPGGATLPEIGDVIRGVTPGQPHQLRYITGRPSNVSYRVDHPFDYPPTYWVVEFPNWEYQMIATSVPVTQTGTLVTFTCRTDNFVNQAITVGASMVDALGGETPEEFWVIREGFCYGKPGTGLIGFVMNDGSAGVDVGPRLVAPRNSLVTVCNVIVKASGAANLAFDILRNGVSVTGTVNLPPGTAPGTIISFPLISNPVNLFLGDAFTINVSSGDSSWMFTAQLQ